MRTSTAALAIGLGSIMLTACSSFNQSASQMAPADGTTTAAAQTVAPEVLSQYTSGWPNTSVQAAQSMILKYGNPSESTQNMLVWSNVNPYKRIVVYKTPVKHRFPLLHDDVIEHVIDYRIPTDRVDELVQFDGSMTFSRTRGELSATGEKEAMNTLALNIGHHVLNGKMDPERARLEYSKIAVDYLNGNKTTYTETLMIGRQMNTADADRGSKINWVTPDQQQPIQAQEATPREERMLKKAQKEEMTE